MAKPLSKSAKKRSKSGRTPFEEDVCVNLDDMTLEAFSLWSMPALKTFLSLRKKSTDGTFTELAARAFISWEDHAAVDPSEEHSLRANLSDYKSRLILGSTVLPDPFTLKDGWLNEKGRVNWPSLYFNDIAAYLKMTTPSELYHRLCNEYKQGKAYRYFSGGLVKEVNYHPINDESSVAFLAAKVTPSMRFSCPPYEAWICVEKDTTNKPGGQIYTAYCTCTAGLKGCCNHVAAVLFRVEYAVRTGLTKPSSTSQTCVWNVPSEKAPSNPIKLCEQVWKKDQYFKQNDGGHARSVRQLATVFSPLTKRQEEYVSQDRVQADLADLIRKHAPESCFLQLNDKIPFPSKPTPVCPPNPKEVAINLGHPNTAAELADAMVLSDEQVLDLQAATIGQSDSEEFVKQRCGRITASNFHRVYTRMKTLKKKPSDDPNPLIRSLMGYSSQPTSLAIKHGKSMEPHAKRAYHSLQSANHRKLKSEDCGLYVHKIYPFLGASPDLLVSCSCCEKGLCEIKCPETIKDQSPSSANWTHLVEENDSNTLSKSSLYYTQIQGQMAILNVSYCDFFVYTAQGHHLERIYFNQEFWEEVQKNLIEFWMKYLSKELIYGSLSNTECDLDNFLIYHSYSSNTNYDQTKTVFSFSKTSCPLSKPKLPKVYLCGKCGGNVDDKHANEHEESVECSKCQMWYHIRCAKSGDLMSVAGDSEWLCFKCK